MIGVPLGKIIPRKLIDNPELVFLRGARSPVTERYRRLASRLDTIADGNPARVVVVTSASPDDGKTLTAANLALAMAETRDRSTLLVDCDLRRPSVAKLLTPQPKLGLSQVLAGDAPLEQALIEVKEQRLVVLPAGDAFGNPLELLQQDYLGALLTQLRRTYDRVVIDTPPVAAAPDAGIVNQHSDGAIVVVRANATKRPVFDRTVDALEDRLLGVVLTDVKFSFVDRYYQTSYEGYYYEEHDDDAVGRKGRKRRRR